MYGNNTDYSFMSLNSKNSPVGNDGFITIHDRPTGKVTIIASKGAGADFEYKFAIASWLNGRTLSTSEVLRHEAAVAICDSNGYQVPTQAMVSNNSQTRQVGPLMNGEI